MLKKKYILIIVFAIIAFIIVNIKPQGSKIKLVINPVHGSKVKGSTISYQNVDATPQKLMKPVELNYDLNLTIEKSKSMKWGCKCPIKNTVIVDGKVYTVFGACESQNGNQLIKYGSEYFVLKKKLQVSEQK